MARSGIEGGGLGETPGGEAVLLRGLSGAPVRRSSVAAAARGSAPGGAMRRLQLGFVATLRGEMVGAEVPRGPIKGRA